METNLPLPILPCIIVYMVTLFNGRLIYKFIFLLKFVIKKVMIKKARTKLTKQN